MNSTVKKTVVNILYVIGVIAAIFLIWYIVSVIVNKDLIAPSPWEVIKLTFTLLGKGSTYLSLLSTLLRSLIAFAVSFAFALGLSLLVGVCPSCKTVTDKAVTVFRAVPTMSIILITLILFSSTAVPAFVAFFVAFPIIYSAFTRETASNARLSDACVVYGVSRRNKIKYVLLPQIRQAIIPQVQDTLPLCIKVVIAGEALSLPKWGFGRQMYMAKLNIDTANVLALTILTLAVCFIIQGTVALCSKKIAK